MKNNLDIDKIMNEYKESLPPVSHSKDEENALLNGILLSAKHSGSPNQKTNPAQKRKILDVIFNLMQKNSFRYSVGFATVLMAIGLGYFYNSSNRTTDNPSHAVVTTNTPQNDRPDAPAFNATPTYDTTLLASIDCDSYTRGGGNSITKQTVFGIIGKQLQKNNIQYQANSILMTQKMRADSGSVLLVFRYSQTDRSVIVSAITQKPDSGTYISVNTDKLVQEIKSTLQHKVRMLYE